MKAKWVIFAVLAAFFVFVAHSSSEAVNTKNIDTIRNKPVLDSVDLQIIDAFLDEAIQELVNTRDFTSISQTRSAILARSSSRKSSAQAQYVEQFSESAHKYISSSFEQAEQLTSEDHRYKVVLNLLILIDGLEDVRLADLAMSFLKDKNTVIRYWAVHSVTSPNFTKKLNSSKTANLQLARRIVAQLKALVESAEGHNTKLLAMVAEFAAEVEIPQGEDLLGQIADMRIKTYANWSVNNELLDSTILKLLYDKITSGAANRRAIARRFGQLYSYAIQRYVKGRSSLNAIQKHQLASVLVEIEKSCISKILAAPQTVIKRSVERDDYTRLLLEHSRLLGDETRAGELPQKLNFDYGTSPPGSVPPGTNSPGLTAPLVLPEPPQKPSTEE
jgi:hypothetical protein